MRRSDMTAYGRMKQDERQAKKRVKKNSTQIAVEKYGSCGAAKRAGGKCYRPAGQGTDHLGSGKCWQHGGKTPSHQKSAIKKEAILLGAPKDINPVDAMIWCIKLAAGEVEFFSEQLASLEKANWYEENVFGKQLNLLARERQKAEDRLFKYSSTAVSLGIAERAVRLAEQYGSSIAKLLKGVLEDLQLNSVQKERAPAIIRKHLILLQGSSPVSDDDRREPIAAIPQRVRSAGRRDD